MEDYFKKLKESPPNAKLATKYELFYNMRAMDKYQNHRKKKESICSSEKFFDTFIFNLVIIIAILAWLDFYVHG